MSFYCQVVELLLKSKEVRSVLASGENRKNDPPLHLASKTGHVEIVRYQSMFRSFWEYLLACFQDRYDLVAAGFTISSRQIEQAPPRRLFCGHGTELE